MNAKRRHILSEKLPILAALLLVLVSLLLELVIVSVLQKTGLSSIVSSSSVDYIASIAAAVLFLILMRLWYAPQYQGTLKSGLSAKETFFVTLPLIVYSLVVTVIGLIQYSFYFNPTFENLLMGLTAGFSEEVLFRVTCIPLCMGFLRFKNRDMLVPIVTGLVFGVLHIGNIANGASVANGIIQVIVTALMGVYYGALFVSTGSAMPGIIMHSIYDFLCFAGDPTLTSGIMTGSLATWEIVYNIVLAAAMAACGIFILKKIGRERILQIWREKWSQASD